MDSCLPKTNIDEGILDIIFERLNEAINSYNKSLIRVVQRVLLNMLAHSIVLARGVDHRAWSRNPL